jgi:hypothetical protein
VLEKEVDAARERVELVQRLTHGLAHLTRQRERELGLVGGDELAKARDGRDPLLERRFRPARLRGARAFVGVGDGRGRVVFQLGEQRAVRGVFDSHPAPSACVNRARKSSSVTGRGLLA